MLKCTALNKAKKVSFTFIMYDKNKHKNIKEDVEEEKKQQRIHERFEVAFIFIWDESGFSLDFFSVLFSRAGKMLQ